MSKIYDEDKGGYHSIIKEGLGAVLLNAVRCRLDMDATASSFVFLPLRFLFCAIFFVRNLRL